MDIDFDTVRDICLECVNESKNVVDGLPLFFSLCEGEKDPVEAFCSGVEYRMETLGTLLVQAEKTLPPVVRDRLLNGVIKNKLPTPAHKTAYKISVRNWGPAETFHDLALGLAKQEIERLETILQAADLLVTADGELNQSECAKSFNSVPMIIDPTDLMLSDAIRRECEAVKTVVATSVKGDIVDDGVLRGVTLQLAASRMEESKQDQQATVKRWRNSKNPKLPPSIGKHPVHSQLNLYRPAAIIAFLENFYGENVAEEYGLNTAFRENLQIPRS